MNEYLVYVCYFLAWYSLVFLSICYAISGIDDLFFDIYYWSWFWYNKIRGNQSKPVDYTELANKEEQWIAILTACWHEADVIYEMLKHNTQSIDYRRYCFFVGVYPNDPDTVAEVQRAAADFDGIHCVIGNDLGPTNKASNLNVIYRYVKEFEITSGCVFNIFITHDSEDVIHPLSLKLYNYHIPQVAMVQLPVFPLTTNHWRCTHWLYAEEFSEVHTKDIFVRYQIGGHVPSAGVGTAFSRAVLEALEEPIARAPFSADSLTEDYQLSLLIRIRQFKQLFLSEYTTRSHWKKSLLHKKYHQVITKEWIATRSFFPMSYKKSVRQKSRWIIGIVFQEWLHTKWPKNRWLRYTLAHDRKAGVTSLINGAGYIVFLFWLIYANLTFAHPQYPSLYE